VPNGDWNTRKGNYKKSLALQFLLWGFAFVFLFANRCNLFLLDIENIVTFTQSKKKNIIFFFLVVVVE